MLGSLVKRHRGSFVGRVGIVFSGSVLGQAIAFLALPLTAQVYPAEVIGRAATVLAIVSMSALVVCLQYDNALVVAPDEDLAYLLLLGMAVMGGWVVLLLGLMLLDSRAAWFGGPGALGRLGLDWNLVLLLATHSVFALMTNLSLRHNRLAGISIARTAYYGGGAVLQVALGLALGASEGVFLWGQILATLLAIPWLLSDLPSLARGLLRVGAGGTLREIVRVARLYGNFPTYLMGALTINAVSMYVPIVFMRVAFSDAWAGWYFLAWRILAGPSTLIGQAVGQVLYRDSAELERGGTPQGQVVETVVLGLLRVSILPAVVVALTVEPLVRIFFGDNWVPTATVIQLLLASTVVGFVTSPVALVLNVKGLQGAALVYSLALASTRLAALALGWWLRSEVLAVAAYSLGSAVVMLPFLGYTMGSVGASLPRVARRLTPLLVDLIPVAVLVAALQMAGAVQHPYALVGVSLLLGLLGWRDLRRSGLLARIAGKGRTASGLA